jgi:hypothetical protein
MGWFEQNAPQPVAQTPEGTTTGVRLNPAGGAPQAATPQGGGDPKATFMQIMGGLPATPQNLVSKEKELQAAGFRVVRSGDGTAGKIGLPGGGIVDVIHGSHAGGGGSWQWLTGPGGGSDALPGGGNFQVGSFTGGGQYPLSSVMGEGLAAPWTTPFNAPDPNTITNDKALQWQMGRGMEAIQRSAAAKGTLLTGGTLKSLDAFGQGLGSTYYNDVYNRKLGEYKMAHDIFEGNQQNLYSRLFGVAGLGQNAAAQVGNAAGQFGQDASNTMLGQGNAAASGTAAGGAAWGNAVGNIGNIAASSYQATHQPQTQSSTYYPGGGYSNTPYIPGAPVGGYQPAPGTW